jgi:hypothetical protein
MVIRFHLYTPAWEPAVARFNRRMLEGHAPAAFDISERAPVPSTGPVRAELFLAVDDEQEVRGGVIVQEHPAWLNGCRKTVINLQSPLSEAIIDAKYAMVSIQLIRFAVKRCPYAYVVGMNREENPLPRLLKASGWNVRKVPFQFRILRAGRCLTQLQPLQDRFALKLAGILGAYSGAGTLALAMTQRQRVSSSGYRLERAGAVDAVEDRLWESVERRISFGIVRDSSTIPSYLTQKLERLRVFDKSGACGWVSLLISTMRRHSYFADLKVATLVDLVAAAPASLGPMAALAVAHAKSSGCDLVVSNQLQTEARHALAAAGFLGYRSNYLLATSKAVSGEMVDETSFVTRQDGDGLVNLHALS